MGRPTLRYKDVRPPTSHDGRRYAEAARWLSRRDRHGRPSPSAGDSARDYEAGRGEGRGSEWHVVHILLSKRQKQRHSGPCGNYGGDAVRGPCTDFSNRLRRFLVAPMEGVCKREEGEGRVSWA